MRCVTVNGAKLKAEAACAHCGNKTDASYVREIGCRQIYCDFRCYSVAVEAPGSPPGFGQHFAA